jgi:pseudoazurin
MRSIIFVLFLIIMSSKLASAETIQIDFTSDDSYSVEVSKIDVGDTIDWLPKNEGHNVEFLGGPDFNSLPEKSDLNAFYSVTFNLTGVYLYHCTPHGNMGMLGLVIVGNDFHNLKDIEGIELSRVAKSVLKRLIRIAKSNS